MITIEAKDKVVGRLQSADGHLAGIIKMIEADRPAEDVLTQLTAVQAALNKINILVYNQEIDSFARRMHNNANEQQRLQGAQRLLAMFAFHPR